MSDDSMNRSSSSEIESALREGLARGDTAFRGIAPVLSHMLDDLWPAIVTEATTARVRGMVLSLADELSSGAAHPGKIPQDELEAFGRSLLSDHPLLDHCFALAVEAQIMEHLASSHSVERVLSPLLQELVGSDEPSIAELAMLCITAQSRFARANPRMQMQLSELPADLFHAVLAKWQEFAVRHFWDLPIQPVEALRKQYDEGATRLALLDRLLNAIGPGSVAALRLPHAGFSLFASALGKGASQARSDTILACHTLRSPRLALSLRAAGLEATEIEPILSLLGGDPLLMNCLDQILPDQAQSILNDTAAP